MKPLRAATILLSITLPAATLSAQQPTLPTGRGESLVQRSALRERAVDMLTEAARDADPLLRANAIEGLHAAPTRIEDAVRAGLVDDNLGVRFVAAMTVGKLQLRSSCPFVSPLLDDPDPRVRAAAMFALARNGLSVDLTPLASSLEHPDARVRAETARILGELGNPSAIPMLRAAAARTPARAPADNARQSEVVRYQLERAFQLQVAEALVLLGEQNVADTLRAALYPAAREGLEASALAAQILGNLRDPRAVRQLIEMVEELAPGAQRFPDPRRNAYAQPKEVRLAAARALAQMGHEDGIYVAEMYADDPIPAIRVQAAFVFSESSSPLHLAPIERLMNDPDPMVRIAGAAAALRLLNRLGPG